MNFLENITFRRNRTRTQSDTMIDNSDIIATTLKCTTANSTSMPELSDDEDEGVQIKRLNDKLLDLDSQLQIARREIELLSSENSKLRETNDVLMKNNDLLNKKSSPIKHKITKKKGTKVKKTDTNMKESKGDDLSTDITKIQTTTTQDVSNILENMEHLDLKVKSQIKLNVNHKYECDNSTPAYSCKNKICLLSTNKKNKILSIAQDLLYNKYDICHYLTPNGTIQQLLSGIQTKLRDYTRTDYCIILVGEEDFKITCNYFNTIVYIRNVLKQLTHTNVIICYPTYILGNYTNICNHRIETFNNLLYLDLITHEHAYYLDSNYYLSWDNMFDNLTGRINNRGMRNIFENLQEFINEINVKNMINCTENVNNCSTTQPSSLFFRS